MNAKWLASTAMGCAMAASIAAFSGMADAQASQSPWLIRGRALAVVPDESANVTILGGDRVHRHRNLGREGLPEAASEAHGLDAPGQTRAVVGFDEDTADRGGALRGVEPA